MKPKGYERLTLKSRSAALPLGAGHGRRGFSRNPFVFAVKPDAQTSQPLDAAASGKRPHELRSVDDDPMPALTAPLAPEREIVERFGAMPGGDEGGEVEQRVAMAVLAGGDDDADVPGITAGNGRWAGFVGFEATHHAPI